MQIITHHYDDYDMLIIHLSKSLLIYRLSVRCLNLQQTKMKLPFYMHKKEEKSIYEKPNICYMYVCVSITR